MNAKPHKNDDLLHAALDGELSVNQRVEFEQLLERDADARERFASLQQLTLIVEELGTVAPPAGSGARDGSRSLNAENSRGPPARTLQGEMAMARKTMIGLAAAAAVVLVTFAITGYPPIGKGTEGTIGQATDIRQRSRRWQPPM